MEDRVKNSTFLCFKSDALKVAWGVAKNSFDAEDIVQESFLKAIRFTGKFPGEADRRAWFLQVVANQAKDHLLKEQRRRRGEGKASRQPVHPCQRSQSAGVEQRELGRLVRKAISFVEEKFRTPVTMRYVKGLSYSEIAETLDMPPSTARVYAHRGIQKVRKMLGQWDIVAGACFLFATVFSLQPFSAGCFSGT